MSVFAISIAIVQALVAVGLLALIQAIVSAFIPGWELPFSVWWGIIVGLPGAAMALFARRF